MPDDRFDLHRFLAAQDLGGTYDRALDELAQGRKTSHWMWFVFPQIAGLGHSAMSTRFAISGLDEAQAYLAHPTLGRRLRECATIVAGLEPDPERIFGPVDAQKLRSSMTLFYRAASAEKVFADVLNRHFGGATDTATDERL